MRWIIWVLTAAAVLLLGVSAVFARVERPVTLSFDPEQDEYNRYMTVISLGGAITRPGEVTFLDATFRIRAVYRDKVASSLHGLNRHVLEFYDYDVFSSPIMRRREDRQFQNGGRGGGGDRGDGGGGGGRGRSADLPPLGDNLQSPPPIGGSPMQADDDQAGDEDPTFSVDDILVSSLVYVESKGGDILDVQGLSQLREYSRRSVSPGEIRVDIGHLFEWNHCLRLPDYPVWREDMWFATIPVNIPGVPEPVMCKFVYRVLGFTRIGMRSVAIIDTHGIVDFHQYWEDETDTSVFKYEAMGDFSIAGRYFFDYEQGMIFGVERPPIFDFETMSFFPGQFGYPAFELKFPGLLANLDMRYYSEETKKPRTRREERLPPEPEPVDRRHVGITFFMQTESE
jgi:hypothetical protein